MTQILALQGLQSETGTGAVEPNSHWSSFAHFRAEAPVAEEAGL
ncbi:hypothetical protein [Kitasatospora sp. SC0581]